MSLSVQFLNSALNLHSFFMQHLSILSEFSQQSLSSLYLKFSSLLLSALSFTSLFSEHTTSNRRSIKCFVLFIKKVLLLMIPFLLGAYNETKYDNVARTLAMMEEELKRTDERVRIAETRVIDVEAELGNIGDNQKQLEVSEEKARQREEKYQEQIRLVNIRLKEAESRSEYAEMNISKLHHKIDELEDEIIREKVKINAVSNQLDDTFNEMLSKY